VHAWIAAEEMGRFNKGFTRSHLVGMPGTAFSAITVASFATRGQWSSADPTLPQVTLDAVVPEDISYFSSPGPTRENLNKPDVAAPGQWIVSALSAAATEEAIPAWMRLPSGGYAVMQGTSMSAPYVTGAVALLLQKQKDKPDEPAMHWAEVKRRLIKSCRQDRYSTPCWNERWGYGKIDVGRLLTIEPLSD
jgi:subtilisin family serine protease